MKWLVAPAARPTSARAPGAHRLRAPHPAFGMPAACLLPGGLPVKWVKSGGLRIDGSCTTGVAWWTRLAGKRTDRGVFCASGEDRCWIVVRVSRHLGGSDPRLAAMSEMGRRGTVSRHRIAYKPSLCPVDLAPSLCSPDSGCPQPSGARFNSDRTTARRAKRDYRVELRRAIHGFGSMHLWFPPRGRALS